MDHITFIAAGLAFAYVMGLDSRRTKKDAARLKHYTTLYESFATETVSGQTVLKRLQSYCNDVSSVAIYGTGTMSNVARYVLSNTGIDIICYIDKNAVEHEFFSRPLLSASEVAQRSDIPLIIVTPIFDYASIRTALQRAGVTVPIISLERLI